MKSWLSTVCRRLLVLLIGGVLAVPYTLVLLWILTVSGRRADVAGPFLVLGTGVLVFALLCLPAFLEVTRALERTLAAHLLDISIPTSPRRPDPGDRLRGAAFYFAHAFSGGVLLVTLFFILPTALVLIVDPAQAELLYREITEADRVPGFLTPGLAVVLAVVVLIVCLGFIVITCFFLPHYSLVLLGPSSADRQELDRRARVEAFRRSTLAREVHDSIGHALTVTTMQAAVAKRLLHIDPTTAEAAIDEIAHTGREAVAELDHVLALLRAEAEQGETSASVDQKLPATSASRTQVRTATSASPRRSVDDIRALAAEARSLGHPVDLTIEGEVSALPTAVSGELHLIVREAMTNSLRHASAPGMSLDLTVADGRVRMVSSNACRTGAAVTRESGLGGIRERVEMLGGTVDWGLEGDRWVLRVALPAEDTGGDAEDTGGDADPGVSGRGQRGRDSSVTREKSS